MIKFQMSLNLKRLFILNVTTEILMIYVSLGKFGESLEMPWHQEKHMTSPVI